MNSQPDLFQARPEAVKPSKRQRPAEPQGCIHGRGICDGCPECEQLADEIIRKFRERIGEAEYERIIHD